MRKYAIINDQDTIIIESSNQAVVLAYWRGFICDLLSYCDILVIESNLIEINWNYPPLGYEYIEMITMV